MGETTFSSEDRRRMSLPLVNDYIVVMEMAEKLGMNLKMSTFFSKFAGEKCYTILGKFVQFLISK